ncbi:MAG: hypothetical protein JRG90_00660 [Deltaproteobacteria bacterium]|nr:hypothetical protein [Deltaproteobacteria bacterium]
MSRTRLQLLIAFITIGLAVATTSPAFGSDPYTVEKVALEGETAPGAGGATYAPIDSFTVDMNAGGDIAFGATLSGPPPNWGVFVYSGGVGSARGLTGDAAPAPLTGSYLAFGYPHIDDTGDVSLGVLVSSGANALLLAGESGDSVLVSDSDTAPGSGGTLAFSAGSLSFHARGTGGAGVFQSPVTGGSNPSGVFVGTSSGVALEGNPSPAGGTYSSFSYPGGNSSGKVAFPATLSGATAAGGLFTDSGGGPVALALEGDLEPGGETFLDFLLPQVNASGAVFFIGTWAPLENGQGGLYVDDFGGLHSMLRTDEPMPETGGATIASMTGLPHFSDGGRITFSATLSGGDFDAGVFVMESNGSVRVVARHGDPVPGTVSDTFTGFGHAAGNDVGQVAFAGMTSTSGTGVFLATAPASPVPSASAAARALIAGLVLLVGGQLVRIK